MILFERGKNFKEFANIVGQVTLHYSYAEHICSLVIDTFLHDTTGTKIFCNINFSAKTKIDEFKKATEDIDHPKVEEFLILLNRLNIVREQRNYFVHSVWSNNPIDHNQLVSLHTKTVGKGKAKLSTQNLKFHNIEEARIFLKDISLLAEDIVLYSATLLVEND